jgi:hypothetical protein
MEEEQRVRFEQLEKQLFQLQIQSQSAVPIVSNSVESLSAEQMSVEIEKELSKQAKKHFDVIEQMQKQQQTIESNLTSQVLFHCFDLSFCFDWSELLFEFFRSVENTRVSLSARAIEFRTIQCPISRGSFQKNFNVLWVLVFELLICLWKICVFQMKSRFEAMKLQYDEYEQMIGRQVFFVLLLFFEKLC